MLTRFVFLTSAVILIATSVLANQADPRDLYLDRAIGESRYFSVQKEWFEAIARLDKERLRKTSGDDTVLSSELLSQAENSLIDYELSYRLHQRDGLSILDQIGKVSDEKLRNAHLFKLAQVHFSKGQKTDAQSTLDRIRGEVLAEIEDVQTFFRAQLLMAGGQYGDAISVLEEFNKSQGLLAFAVGDKKQQGLFGLGGYNLGIANFSHGNKEEGLLQLDLVGQLSGSDEATLSIRDKANLLHGEQLLISSSYEEAGLILDRVRLQGPYSSLALLSSGWVAALQENYEQALVPWTLLAERAATDSAVQEALLAVPYCYSKLGIYKKAAELYGRAAEAFGNEIDTLTSSITSIQDGYFSKALIREESKHDSVWVVNLRDLPNMPETHYLLDLMATHEFQNSLNNYLDLGRIHKRLNRWQQDLTAYEELISKRRTYYEPILPDIDKKMRRIDRKKIRTLKKRDEVGQQLLSLQKENRLEIMATSMEKRELERIDEVDRLLEPYHVVKSRARIERLRGLVYWSIYSNYEQRLKSIESKLRDLDDVFASYDLKRENFALMRRTASESIDGYNKPIEILRSQISKVLDETITVMAAQGEILEAMLESELVEKRDKLKEMQTKAQFAMAENYDRATMKKSSGGRGR